MPELPDNDPSSVFLGLMLKNQRSIRNYIYSLHPSSQDLDDLVQQTAMTLWRDFERYDATRDFLPWALRVAYFEVLRLRKKKSRDRLVFSEELVEILAAETVTPTTQDAQSRALQHCLAKLDPQSRDVLMARYSKGDTVHGLAAQQSTSVHRLYRLLDNARASLVACIRRQLQIEGFSIPNPDYPA